MLVELISLDSQSLESSGSPLTSRSTLFLMPTVAVAGLLNDKMEFKFLELMLGVILCLCSWLLFNDSCILTFKFSEYSLKSKKLSSVSHLSRSQTLLMFLSESLSAAIYIKRLTVFRLTLLFKPENISFSFCVKSINIS